MIDESVMKIIDISWPICSATTAYKDRKTIEFQATKDIVIDGARESCLRMGAHSGTHVDAPSHFLLNGKTIDQILLEHLIGRCQVLDMTMVTDGITSDHLHKHNIGVGDIILLKTTNSQQPYDAPFNPHFIYVTADAAQYLKKREIKAVGIDYLGIERNQPNHATHTTLMEANIVIIEGLRLAHVQPGVYQFICLPLHIMGLEAAPARAILVGAL